MLTWNQVCNNTENVLAAKKLHNCCMTFFSEIGHVGKHSWGKVVAANHSICRVTWMTVTVIRLLDSPVAKYRRVTPVEYQVVLVVSIEAVL